MAGTVTVAEVKSKPIKQITWAWTCTAGGAADKASTTSFYGKVIEMVTVPAGGGSAPTDNYDLTITDANSYDILQGAGANRDTANTERAAPAAVSVAFGVLTLNVSNAGNAKSGTVILYIQ